MELREPEATDTERVRELAESTMTASFSLSPQQIEALLEEGFDEERLTQPSDESITLLTEHTINGDETTIAGIVEAEHTDDGGEVCWLFVDPEHRGQGIGTELFETGVKKLRKQGAEPVRASTLEANREGNQFPEQFDFERTDDRTVEVAGESLVEYCYTESSVETESASEPETEGFDGDLPNTGTENGIPTATSGGQQVYINREEDDSGTEAPFFAAYTDEEFTDQFGYYCANCGSLDTTMDDVGRVECSECSNIHAERSEKAYDDSYL